ncbi:hypothetical protein [Eupransor demetentiae]|uniref:Uncharacterized protein n=1 Tax=Eupransor demetentiae TaxID=3109584 RepID=A0ABP0ER51_9LACO|nr:hypothetical protein R54876_GBNLAHCA_00074 [Lactobacillaceae bacterium LMG 33000]
MTALNPEDLRSLAHKDERFRRAEALLKNDWSQVLLDYPRTNQWISLADIAFAKRLSAADDDYPAFDLQSFSQVQAFIAAFQSYLSNDIIKKLKEPYL